MVKSVLKFRLPDFSAGESSYPIPVLRVNQMEIHLAEPGSGGRLHRFGRNFQGDFNGGLRTLAQFRSGRQVFGFGFRFWLSD